MYFRLFSKPSEWVSLATLLILITTAHYAPHPQISPVRPATGKYAYLVNARHFLLPNYTPDDLVVPKVPLITAPQDPDMHLSLPAAQALERLFAAADRDHIPLILVSGYRSYLDQYVLYAAQSTTFTPTAEFIAPPGTSEHQTGLAADVSLAIPDCMESTCFMLTTAVGWLNKHACQFGFIVRYPLHKEALTGVTYEPWHIRYVGVPVASYLQQTGMTLDQIPAYSYPPFIHR